MLTREDLLVRYEEVVRKCSELLDQQAESARLLSRAIHDLRNPVSSIISSCDYLTAYCTETIDPEQMEMISRIEASARTLLDCSERIRGIAGQLAARASA
jgi:light-regulated signal transduction histidine kinase (bacteriophytochrome)